MDAIEEGIVRDILASMNNISQTSWVSESTYCEEKREAECAANPADCDDSP